MSLAVIASGPGVEAQGRPVAAGRGAVVATGSVTCTKLRGRITFVPPAHHGGDSPETQVFSITAGRCTTRGSNVSHVQGGHVRAVIHRPTNSCLTLLMSQPTVGTGNWAPSSIRSTTASFSGYGLVRDNAGYAGFTLPNAGGTAKVSGSFAGSDHGAASKAVVYLKLTDQQFLAACNSSGGLAAENILGGTATFG